jgi:hypothetical protein
MKKTILLISILLAFFVAQAQNPVNYYQYLPKGYQLKDVNGNAGPASTIDFDKDGINDLAIIVFSEKNGTPIFCIYLSSTFDTSKSFNYCEWPYMMHDLNFANGKLSLFSDNGSMGQYGLIEMQYDALKRDFKITKYEDDNGNKNVAFKVWKF